MKKKVLAVVLGMSMVVAMMTGCGASKETSDSANSAEKTYTIGISQFAEHGSLDNCREGFIEGLKEEGLEEGKNLKIVTNNADADTGTAAQIADQFVADKVDMICAIATPSAQAAYNAAMETDIPVVYTAVTNPVAAELANDDKSPVGNVTGTSDELPVEAQLKMIREILPDAKTIGIIYTTSEPNSVSAIAEYKEKAGNYGFTIEAIGVADQASVTQAADTLINKKVDCITNLTDNNVVGVLPSILEKTNAAGIPVYGSEIEQVKKGCVASAGIDYVELGKMAGKLAAQILKGEAKASDLPYETVTEYSTYINSDAASAMGITVPSDVAAKAIECK